MIQLFDILLIAQRGVGDLGRDDRRADHYAGSLLEGKIRAVGVHRDNRRIRRQREIRRAGLERERAFFPLEGDPALGADTDHSSPVEDLLAFRHVTVIMRIAVDEDAAEHPEQYAQNRLVHHQLRHMKAQRARPEYEHRDGIIENGSVIGDQDRLAADMPRLYGFIFIIHFCAKTDEPDRPAGDLREPVE